MAATEHREYLVSFERIKAALVAAQAARRERNDMVETPNGTELGWIVFERETVWRAVNDERARLGRGPVSLTDLARAESMANGHSDYTKKFALYAAEVAWDAQ